VTESLEAFRRSARAIAKLAPDTRRQEFHRLLGEVLPQIEDRARRTGDVVFLVTAMSEVWQVGHDLGVVALPPPSSDLQSDDQSQKDS
jgi:hypothetical protein